MKKIKLGGHRVSVYDSIDELPMVRFHKYYELLFCKLLHIRLYHKYLEPNVLGMNGSIVYQDMVVRRFYALHLQHFYPID